MALSPIEWNPSASTRLLFVALSVFLYSAIATALVRRVATAVKFVFRPKEDRWGSRIVALGGGVATSTALAIGIAVFFPALAIDFLPPLALCFIVGFVDDIRGLMPKPKLLAEIAAALWLVARGYVLPMPLPLPLLPEAATILWVVGIVNAVNMIDNMDGLAAGIAIIVALGLVVIFPTIGSPSALAGVAAVLAAAMAGFLIHNRYPARIFMGDGGSLPLGCLLAAMATRVRSAHEGRCALVAIALLFVYPLFDLTLVCVTRVRSGRPVYVGNRDHSSHRLVAAGLSESLAVSVAYGAGIAGAIAASVSLAAPLGGVVAIAAAALLFFLAAGLLLARMVPPSGTSLRRELMVQSVQ